MAIELKIPPMGESISEVEIGEWKKSKGAPVQKDEPLVALESEKATVEMPAPAAGVLASVFKQSGETVRVGEVIGLIEETSASPTPKASEAAERAQPPAGHQPGPTARVMPAAQRVLSENQLRPQQVQATGPGGRVLKDDVVRFVQSSPGKLSQTSGVADGPKSKQEAAEPAAPGSLEPIPPGPGPTASEQGTSEIRGELPIPMSRLRRTVAERLVQAQQNAALLTSFNEADMSTVLSLRKELGEAFQDRYGTKLGLMSFFVKACTDALRLVPQVNAEIRGKEIIQFRYCDIGVAIGGGKGLVVPVLRNAERLGFAEIELIIADFAKRAKENLLKPEELHGGTFTISNGGIYGSLLSTPIVNPPQSGVLGMHAIQERPVAREGQVVIRPMMYLALTYDHRIVDGREAVTFLKHIKDVIENPVRLMIQV
jgi:2-oxoglutarate dehydrogenase E2 component (dihydrolipoamide succinyltransferase)